MPAPHTPFEAVLHAARDVAKLDCAFDAELLGTALLGSVYAVADDDRAAAVRGFVGAFLAETGARDPQAETAARDPQAETRARDPAVTPTAAATIRAVFAALVPDADGAHDVDAGTQAPAWVGQLGRVRPTGAYSYGDAYGDQTSYVATFAYDDPAGGPEHAVVVLIDHNIGIAKDIFVGGPAEVVVGQIRELCAGDELTWFTEIPPAKMRTEVGPYLEITDSMSSLPGDGSVATDRALVGARLTALPAEPQAAGDEQPRRLDGDQRKALVADFLSSPEAADEGLTKLGDADQLSLNFSLSLLLDHAETFPDLDPLRWSPVMAQLFLLDWVHRRAVLDDSDAAILPRALRGWVAYAARRRGAPETAVRRTVESVDELAPEFARLHASGERRSPATQAVAQLIAEGVDPANPDAVTAWLASNGNGGRPD